jgi:hypothetical protein
MPQVNMERWRRKQKLLLLKKIWVILRRTSCWIYKNRNKLKKAKEKPKAGPKGNDKKMMDGGKVAGYKNGGCVMSGRGGKYKGAM